MKTRLTTYGTKLKWIQESAFTPSYKLYDSENQIATLKLPHAFNETGYFDHDGKKWSMNRKGLFSGAYRIRDDSSGLEVGEIRQFAFRANEIEIFNFGVFKMKSLNFWGTYWKITDSFDRALLKFSPYGNGFRDILKTQAVIDIAPGFETNPNLHLLIAASWYLKIMIQQTAAAVAAAS